MNISIQIDSNACVQAAYKLTQVNRSAYPYTCRQTLNKAAMDVKQDVSDNNKNPFIHRNLTFFKASSRVEFAKGYDVNTMRSIVGFTPNPKRKTKNDYSVKDLEQQEDGGMIGSKTFIPLKRARVSGSPTKQIQGRFRLNTLYGEKGKGIVDADNNKKGKNDAQRLILSAIHAGVGKAVIGTMKSGKQIMFYINSYKRVDGNTKVNWTDIYSVKHNRKVEPLKGAHHHFMRDESLCAAQDMQSAFNTFARQNIQRALEKSIL